jgi:hypothetical protein
MCNAGLSREAARVSQEPTHPQNGSWRMAGNKELIPGIPERLLVLLLGSLLGSRKWVRGLSVVCRPQPARCGMWYAVCTSASRVARSLIMTPRP